MEIYSKLSRFFPNQFRQPTGWLGQIVGLLEGRCNETTNDFILSNLQLEAGDVVLETGFGPGVTIRKLAKRVGHGKVLGVDFSREMAAQARNRNAQVIRDGQVLLLIGDICAVPLPSNFCDKILGVSVSYFLDGLQRCLKELLRVLKPAGTSAFM
jgi:ubiquinone/menaquinone biosynthesis C-methylase UbiE